MTRAFCLALLFASSAVAAVPDGHSRPLPSGQFLIADDRDQDNPGMETTSPSRVVISRRTFTGSTPTHAWPTSISHRTSATLWSTTTTAAARISAQCSPALKSCHTTSSLAQWMREHGSCSGHFTAVSLGRSRTVTARPIFASG